MPNWVNNELVITGPTEVLQKIAKQAPQKESEWRNASEFSFHSFVPWQFDDPKYQDGRKAGCAGSSENPDFNWYAWNNDNWGCKWDADNSKLRWDGNSLIATFDTPWSPPDIFLSKFSELFPDVTLQLYAFEEQGQFIKMRWRAGTLEQDHWTWVQTDEMQEKAALDFLHGLGVKDVENFVNIKTFVNEVWFEYDEITRIRDYATVGIHVCTDTPTVLNALNLATGDGGFWTYDDVKRKYKLHKKRKWKVKA